MGPPCVNCSFSAPRSLAKVVASFLGPGNVSGLCGWTEEVAGDLWASFFFQVLVIQFSGCLSWSVTSTVVAAVTGKPRFLEVFTLLTMVGIEYTALSLLHL